MVSLVVVDVFAGPKFLALATMPGVLSGNARVAANAEPARESISRIATAIHAPFRREIRQSDIGITPSCEVRRFNCDGKYEPLPVRGGTRYGILLQANLVTGKNAH